MPGPNDVILIYFDDQPSLYARVECVEPDIKKNWLHVTLLLLTIPMQTVTWILRDEYLAGSPFTMGGRPVRLEGVKRTTVKTARLEAPSKAGKEERGGTQNIIPFKKPKK